MRDTLKKAKKMFLVKKIFIMSRRTTSVSMFAIDLLIYARQFGELNHGLINSSFPLEITTKFQAKELGEERESLPCTKISMHQKNLVKDHMN